MKPQRQRYIPEDTTLVDNLGTDAAVYIYIKNGSPYAIAFHGKAQKPDWHFRFTDREGRRRRIAEFVEGRRAHAEAAAERRAEQRKPHTLKPGDILVSSWGYDQTNVDYYQVTELNGKRMVTVRPIGAESQETGFMTGNCTPTPDNFTGEPMRKRASADNTIRMASYAWARPWDGKPDRWSSYA